VRIRNFINYRIAATLQLLVFFFIAVFAFKPKDYVPADFLIDPAFVDRQDEWPDFFHMPVLMLMLITLLNDGTLISIGYDNVTPEKTPEVWNLRVVFSIGAVLAGVACVSSLILLWLLLDSWHPNSIFQKWGLGGVSYGQITTAVYLKVSVSDFLTLFSSRGGADWFWSSRPANILLFAAGAALSCSTILAASWPQSHPDGILALGLGREKPYALTVYIWIYCIVWWFIQVQNDLHDTQ
jgi:H+-transporting ATPase